ncbi:MAG: YkgJ family cysteine cluster protein [Cyanobacteriota bacterium]
MKCFIQKIVEQYNLILYKIKNFFFSHFENETSNEFLYKIKIFLLTATGKKYIKTGKCNACGNCCKNISVKHGNKVIKSLEQFESLQRRFSVYRMFKVMDTSEQGVVFQCIYLDNDTGKCTDYENRPPICRNYPHEIIFKLGGNLSDTCGFSFIPIKSFKKVFTEVENTKCLQFDTPTK